MHVYKNTIISMGQQFNLMKLNIEKGNVEDAKNNADIGNRIVGATMEMIEKMLKLLRGVSEKFVLVNLFDCIELAISSVGPDISFVKNYDADKQLMISGDKQHLTEVFKNLFFNSERAAQTADRRCVITIDIVREDDFCMVCVRDNGIGIKKHNFHKIFEPFYSTKPKLFVGGIGLSYVKNVVKIHGGEIKVKSKYGEYSEFQIAFPSLSEKKLLHWGDMA